MNELSLGTIIEKNPNFTLVYEQICNCLRQSGNLDKFQSQFENSTTDLDRVRLVRQLCDFTNVLIEKKQSKNCVQASEFEKRFDQQLLVVDNDGRHKCIELISKSLQYTTTEDEKNISIRYGKRAWCHLLKKDYESACADANRSLKYDCADDVWKAYEILGHCHTKAAAFTAARSTFEMAIERLRKSKESNAVKAEAAMRIAVVIKAIIGLLDKPQKLPHAHQPPPTSLPLPFKGRNKVISSASSQLTIQNSISNGRGLFAKQDIPPGSVIIAENAYAAVLNECRWDTHCIRCFKFVTNSIPCDTCSKVIFCSENCKEDLNSFHRKECSILPYLYDQTLGVVAPLAYRIILTSGLQNLIENRKQLLDNAASGNEQDSVYFDLCDKYSSENYFAVFKQVTNSDKRLFGNLFKRVLAGIYLTQCLKCSSFFGDEQRSSTSEDIDFVTSLVVRHLQSCSCNAYEISERIDPQLENSSSLTRDIGSAVYSTISLTNHSCASNCYRYNIGTAGVLRASKLIKKGCQIYDNYGYFYYTQEIGERQEALRSHYMFDCSCIACVNAWPTYANEQNQISFKCPQTDCTTILTDYFGVRGCDNCCEKKSYKKFLHQIKKKINAYEEINESLKGKYTKKGYNLLLEHQMFLDNFSTGSNKHYIRVQESILRCFLRLDNTDA